MILEGRYDDGGFSHYATFRVGDLTVHFSYRLPVALEHPLLGSLAITKPYPSRTTAKHVNHLARFGDWKRLDLAELQTLIRETEAHFVHPLMDLALEEGR